MQSCYPACSNNPIGLSATLANTNYASNNVYAADFDLTVTNGTTTTFTNSEIIVGAGKKITIQNGGKLILKACHLYSCATMWQGIKVEAGGVLNIIDEGNKSNFIEDADTAISYNFKESDLAKYNDKFPLLTASTIIFNRNNVGIKINSEQSVFNVSNSVFNVYNCIFTSRHINFGRLSWVNLNTLKTKAGIPFAYPNAPQLSNSHI